MYKCNILCLIWTLVHLFVHEGKEQINALNMQKKKT